MWGERPPCPHQALERMRNYTDFMVRDCGTAMKQAVNQMTMVSGLCRKLGSADDWVAWPVGVSLIIRPDSKLMRLAAQLLPSFLNNALEHTDGKLCAAEDDWIFVLDMGRLGLSFHRNTSSLMMHAIQNQ
jgi:hypothetical protein